MRPWPCPVVWVALIGDDQVDVAVAESTGDHTRRYVSTGKDWPR